MVKQVFLSLAAAAFVFGAASALQPAPAQACNWNKSGATVGVAVGGWSSNWHAWWQAKMERKRAWWAAHSGGAKG